MHDFFLFREDRFKTLSDTILLPTKVVIVDGTLSQIGFCWMRVNNPGSCLMDMFHKNGSWMHITLQRIFGLVQSAQRRTLSLCSDSCRNVRML